MERCQKESFFFLKKSSEGSHNIFGECFPSLAAACLWVGRHPH